MTGILQIVRYMAVGVSHGFEYVEVILDTSVTSSCQSRAVCHSGDRDYDAEYVEGHHSVKDGAFPDTRNQTADICTKRAIQR